MTKNSSLVMTGKSQIPKDVLLNKLKALAPEIFSEGKVDWERLKATLGEDIDFKDERYVLNWAGKSDALRVLQQPSTGTLKPEREESTCFDETQNLFIEGENLEVLKILQKSYFGKVKMIYIDPPYNTGNDSFIYPDKFSETRREYQKRVGDRDDEGYMTREGLYRKNSRENGHYHSRWLSMLYPRLCLARSLLRPDGVIFVSIDDNEVHNLRLLMNEIFGEENFVECITWNKRVPKNDKGIGNIHEYVLIYLKNSDWDYKFTMPKDGLDDIDGLVADLKRKATPLPDAEKEIRKLYNKKGYDRGITLYNSLDKDYKLWGKINLSWPNANTFGAKYDVLHPITKKPVKIPERGWRWKKETFESFLNYKNVQELHDGSFICGKIWFDKHENIQPSSIKYLKEVDSILLRSFLSLKSDGGIEIEKLFKGKSYFSYPKPTALLKIFIQSFDLSDGDIVLDFFAGSGTTAHAVMALNREDGGRRKYICVQLPEACDEKSEAFKAGYPTIADIAKERIRRAAAAIRKESPDYGGDLGFKVFKLSDSNFKLWRQRGLKTVEALEAQLDLFVDPMAENASTEAVIYELLLKSGFDLNSRIEKKFPAGEGNGYWCINGDELILMLEKATREIIDGIIKERPRKAIALDRSFEGDDPLKTNTVLQMREAGIDFRTI